MKNQKIEIIDESGDKKYFSQLPHYILNHSTANDQALYWQMKRYSGETGKCFATSETIMKKLGIGRKAFNKSLKYLLDKGWIKHIGKTQGKTRPINTYAIVDIWKLNILHYEEISPKRTVSSKKKIGVESKVDKSPKNTKISAERTVEEEPYKEEHNNKIAKQGFAGSDLNKLIDLFEPINPSFERLFKNTTQRDSLERLAKKHGVDKIEWTIKVLSKTNFMKFAPTITTPLQLEDKLGTLILFLRKEKTSLNQNKIARI